MLSLRSPWRHASSRCQELSPAAVRGVTLRSVLLAPVHRCNFMWRLAAAEPDGQTSDATPSMQPHVLRGAWSIVTGMSVGSPGPIMSISEARDVGRFICSGARVGGRRSVHCSLWKLLPRNPHRRIQSFETQPLRIWARPGGAACRNDGTEATKPLGDSCAAEPRDPNRCSQSYISKGMWPMPCRPMPLLVPFWGRSPP